MLKGSFAGLVFAFVICVGVACAQQEPTLSSKTHKHLASEYISQLEKARHLLQKAKQLIQQAKDEMQQAHQAKDAGSATDAERLREQARALHQQARTAADEARQIIRSLQKKSPSGR